MKKMKEHILQEQIISILKSYNKQYEVLTESKLKVLIDKIGMSEENAKVLDDKFGPLSVWMAKKIGEWYTKLSPKDYPTPKDALRRLFFGARSFTSQFSSIKDYIVVGLNGNKSSLDDLNYMEIYSKSKVWHDELKRGGGQVNYKETNPIILDFRDEDGNGYYWVDLQTSNSSEECDRMGHCGRSGKGNLYSLRSYSQVPGGKFKVNKSHLTAAVGEDGILYQLKGPKNAKPKEEYHKYILPLFDLQDDDDDYFIKGFGTEYASQQDFKLEDLPIQTLKDLYGIRPELFKSRGLQSKMKELGIEIEFEPLPTLFYYDIEFEYIHSYIQNDEIINSREVETTWGANYNVNTYLSQALLEPNKLHELYEWVGNEYSLPSYKYPSLEKVLKENVYPSLRSHIIRLLKMMEPTEEQLKQLEKLETEPNLNISILAHLMRQIDSEKIMIINDIYDAYDISYRDVVIYEAIDILKDSLINTLKNYGDVIVRDYGAIGIDGDIEDLVDIDDPRVIYTYQGVEEEYGDIYVENVFRELVNNEIIDTPRWTRPEIDEVDIDNDRFNEELNERLNYIERYQI
jgi:hypothetical protein